MIEQNFKKDHAGEIFLRVIFIKMNRALQTSIHFTTIIWMAQTLYTDMSQTQTIYTSFKLTSIGVRSSRILSAEFTHSLTSKLSSENLEKSIL